MIFVTANYGRGQADHEMSPNCIYLGDRVIVNGTTSGVVVSVGKFVGVLLHRWASPGLYSFSDVYSC